MTSVWPPAMPQVPGNCSFTVLVQAAMLEKLMEKAQYEEINNESESHQAGGGRQTGAADENTEAAALQGWGLLWKGR